MARRVHLFLPRDSHQIAPPTHRYSRRSRLSAVDSLIFRKITISKREDSDSGINANLCGTWYIAVFKANHETLIVVVVAAHDLITIVFLGYCVLCRISGGADTTAAMLQVVPLVTAVVDDVRKTWLTKARRQQT